MVAITPILETFSIPGTALLTRSAVCSSLDTLATWLAEAGVGLADVGVGACVDTVLGLDNFQFSSGSLDLSAMQRLSHRDLMTDTLHNWVGLIFKILTSLSDSKSSDTMIRVVSLERLGLIIPPKILILFSKMFFLALPIPVDTIWKCIPVKNFDVAMAWKSNRHKERSILCHALRYMDEETPAPEINILLCIFRYMIMNDAHGHPTYSAQSN